jgi:homogentisate 1,2-dioxygenase
VLPIKICVAYCCRIGINKYLKLSSGWAPKSVAPEIGLDKNMQMRSLQGFNVEATDDYLESRTPMLVNNDVYIELAAPKKSMTDYFYKNADADEVIFIHRGNWTLKTQL